MIVVSKGLDALTAPRHHEALRTLLGDAFGRGAVGELVVAMSLSGTRQYFSFQGGVPVAVLSVRVKGALHCARSPLANVIYNAATARRHRRKGHMRRLLNRVIADHRRSGKRHLNLEVLADNHNAVQLYTSLGFQTICSRDGIAHMRLRL